MEKIMLNNQIYSERSGELATNEIHKLENYLNILRKGKMGNYS